MGSYVAIIEVNGTDIEEWYEFDEPLDKDEIKQIWLDDVRDNRSLGEQLAQQFEGQVKVTQTWKAHSDRQEKRQKEMNPPALEGEEEDNGETST